jgi:hypothetical protein
MERSSDVAMGHTRRRRLRNLPGGFRRHMSYLQIPWRRLSAAYDIPMGLLDLWLTIQYLQSLADADTTFTWWAFWKDTMDNADEYHSIVSLSGSSKTLRRGNVQCADRVGFLEGSTEEYADVSAEFEWSDNAAMGKGA